MPIYKFLKNIEFNLEVVNYSITMVNITMVKFSVRLINTKT